MINKTNFIRWIDSSHLFTFLLIGNVAVFFLTFFYPSMDGPAHLHNAKVLLEVILGNKELADFYTINTLPIPNWTSHFLLAFFIWLLPAFMAEKMLLIFYFIGLSLSFRLLITQLAPLNKGYSLLVFPFAYTFLFHLGFYNYSLSFVFFFLSLWVFLKHRHSRNVYVLIAQGIFISLAYLSNILVFVFLGLVLACFSFYLFIDDAYSQKSIRRVFQKHLVSTILLFLISLPALLCCIIFYIHVRFYGTDQVISVQELFKWIIDVRPLIIYDYAEDEIYSRKIFYVFVCWFFLIIYQRIRNAAWTFKLTDVTLIPFIIALVLFFLVPDGSGAGMMSLRYIVMVFIFLLLWLSVQEVNSMVKLLVPFVVLLSAPLLYHHVKALRRLDQDASEIYQLSHHVKAGSIVLPINFSDHWIEPHFSNYIGVDKPIVVLENYEASVGWFPLKWNKERMPRILLGEKSKLLHLQWPTNEHSKNNKKIDYVLVYGDYDKLKESKWDDLKSILYNDFKLIKRTEYVTLFKSRGTL